MTWSTLLIIYTVGWLSGVCSVLLWGLCEVRNNFKGK